MLIKKLLALAVALTVCLSVTACGDSDSSGDALSSENKPFGALSSSADSSVESTESKAGDTFSSKAENSKAETSKVETSKVETSKVETSKAETTAAVTSKAEEQTTAKAESKAETTTAKQEAKEAESQAEPAVTEPQESFTVKGTGYTVEFGPDWVDMARYKDEMEKQTAGNASDMFGLDVSEFEGFDAVCAYKPDGNACPVFNVADPVADPSLEGLTAADIETILVASIQQQYADVDGITFESRGIKDYNGEKFIELFTLYDNEDLHAKARQFFAVHNCTEYVISFSMPGDSYDALYDETEEIMKSFRFTEE